MKTFPEQVQAVFAAQKKNVGSAHTSAGETPLPAETHFPSGNYMN